MLHLHLLVLDVDANLETVSLLRLDEVETTAGGHLPLVHHSPSRSLALLMVPLYTTSFTNRRRPAYSLRSSYLARQIRPALNAGGCT
jgi:hypothetical protein